MNSHARTARIAGALFLIAIVASIVGGTIIESALPGPDLLADAAQNTPQVAGGVLLELVNGVAIIGIAVLLYPVFKPFDEALALGYVAFRLLEAVIAVAAVIGPLALIVLSQDHAQAAAADVAHFQAVGAALLAERAVWVGSLLGLSFSVVGLVIYIILYRSKLVPRFISIWGFIAVPLVFTWNVLEMFGINVSFGMVLALPIMLNEIFLAIWLIVKGFSSPAT